MYHFECESCGKRFEELVAYSRRDEMTCPDCHSQTRVLVSSFAAKVGGGGSSLSAPARPRFT
ncbi:MAG: FmdB family zinc ribbon protein [Bacillota bacterium]